jgi:hypothetical protein
MSAVQSLTGGDPTWRGRPNSVENDPYQMIHLNCEALHMRRPSNLLL